MTGESSFAVAWAAQWSAMRRPSSPMRRGSDTWGLRLRHIGLTTTDKSVVRLVFLLAVLNQAPLAVADCELDASRDHIAKRLVSCKTAQRCECGDYPRIEFDKCIPSARTLHCVLHVLHMTS